ncbi:MAG: hypothetical protein KIT57_03675 [Blastocatellales bacterium]|nr:hypothetical protein [Blastocatellales bacterium]
MHSQQHSPSQVRSFAFQGSFLEQFPSPRRSLVANQFCAAVRAGADSVAAVLAWVAQDARRRIADRFLEKEARSFQVQLLAALETDEAAEFARFIIERERLTAEEKERLRAADRLQYVRATMATYPPSEAQLDLIAKLGSRELPRTRLDASDLIEWLIAKKGERR